MIGLEKELAKAVLNVVCVAVIYNKPYEVSKFVSSTEIPLGYSIEGGEVVRDQINVR